MRPAQSTAVIVSDFSVETLKRLLGKQLLARYSNNLRFVDSDGTGGTKNPFLRSHYLRRREVCRTKESRYRGKSVNVSEIEQQKA